MKDRIYLSSPHMCGDELKFIQEAFDTNWIAPLGPNVKCFEKEVREYANVKASVALSNGTSAIHLALKCLDVKENDIVFCQSLTFSGTCNPIIYQGAIPVFIDSDYETWNMSPKALEKAFEDAVKTEKMPKAVIVVNLYGQSANYDSILSICNKYNVPVIEDAAESLGASYKGRKTGTLGEIGIYSFNGNKIITTSSGGMMVSNNEEYIKKSLFWATQAKDNARYYLHSELGYNYRMSNVLAGIGRGQLKVLDERVNKKTYIYDTYKNAFKNIEGIEMMPVYETPNHWLSVITLKENLDIKPVDIIDALELENIESRHIWNPMHKQPFFKKYKFFSSLENGSVAEDLFNRGICLPSDTKMSDDDLDRVINTVKHAITQKTLLSV